MYSNKEYFIVIAVVIVLVAILAYFMWPAPKTTVSVNYSLAGGAQTGTCTMTILQGSKSVSNSFSFPYSTKSNCPTPNNGVSTPLVNINYDVPGSNLNFWYVANGSHSYICEPPIQVSSTDKTNTVMFDFSNVVVASNVVTFTTGSDKLVLTFTNPFK